MSECLILINKDIPGQLNWNLWLQINLLTSIIILLRSYPLLFCRILRILCNELERSGGERNQLRRSMGYAKALLMLSLLHLLLLYGVMNNFFIVEAQPGSACIKCIYPNRLLKDWFTVVLKCLHYHAISGCRQRK